jgi:predicted nuclease of predicted toxin-antitoxin system
VARILLDEDLGPTVARILTELGHDVRAIILETRGVGDVEVLAEAVRDNRILVTCDRGYVRLVFRHLRPSPLALIHLRIDPATREEKARAIADVRAFIRRGRKVRNRQTQRGHAAAVSALTPRAE